MPSCTVCKQPTLFDGICTQCSEKRFDDYPRIKSQLDRIIANLKEKKIWEQVKHETGFED